MSTFRNTEISAKLGEEFEETTPDDRHVKVSWVNMETLTFAFAPSVWDGLKYSLTVNYLHGGRQAGASAEVEWQGDQICQRNQGWKDGDGKKMCKFMWKPEKIATQTSLPHFVYSVQ